jgi:hypothetical protein
LWPAISLDIYEEVIKKDIEIDKKKLMKMQEPEKWGILCDFIYFLTHCDFFS